MARTYRKKERTYDFWYEKMDTREKRKWHGDAYNHDGDMNPPKDFKKNEIRKHRHKMNVLTRQSDDPVIDAEFKMPYYT